MWFKFTEHHHRIFLSKRIISYSPLSNLARVEGVNACRPCGSAAMVTRYVDEESRLIPGLALMLQDP